MNTTVNGQQVEVMAKRDLLEKLAPLNEDSEVLIAIAGSGFAVGVEKTHEWLAGGGYRPVIKIVGSVEQPDVTDGDDKAL